MSLPVIVLGAGGHAKVLIDALLASDTEIIGAVAADSAQKGKFVGTVPILGGDEEVLKYSQNAVCLVNAVGSVGLPFRRRELFVRFKWQGYSFATVVHPSAVLASGIEFGEGAQIMAGVVVQPGCSIGANTIINTRTSVDHDCCIGDHVHIGPGTVLCGNVSIDNCSHVGPGVTIIQGTSIGKRCVVGAGSVVLNNFSDGMTVYGVPAKGISR